MLLQTPLTKSFMAALLRAIEKEGLRNLAARAGVSVTTMSNWVNRGSVPSLDGAARTAQAIGFDLGKYNR